MGEEVEENPLPFLFYAQTRIWKFAVSQHAGRAASREKIFPTRLLFFNPFGSLIRYDI